MNEGILYIVKGVPQGDNEKEKKTIHILRLEAEDDVIHETMMARSGKIIQNKIWNIFE